MNLSEIINVTEEQLALERRWKGYFPKIMKLLIHVMFGCLGHYILASNTFCLLKLLSVVSGLAVWKTNVLGAGDESRAADGAVLGSPVRAIGGGCPSTRDSSKLAASTLDILAVEVQMEAEIVLLPTPPRRRGESMLAPGDNQCNERLPKPD